jgi:hypothetical protein
MKASSWGELQWQFHLFIITPTSIRTHKQLVYFLLWWILPSQLRKRLILRVRLLRTRELLSITKPTKPWPWEANSYGAFEKKILAIS